MLASEMIIKIQELIKEHGDCNMYYYDFNSITNHDSADVVKVKKYGFGNDTKIFYIE